MSGVKPDPQVADYNVEESLMRMVRKTLADPLFDQIDLN